MSGISPTPELSSVLHQGTSAEAQHRTTRTPMITTMPNVDHTEMLELAALTERYAMRYEYRVDGSSLWEGRACEMTKEHIDAMERIAYPKRVAPGVNRCGHIQRSRYPRDGLCSLCRSSLGRREPLLPQRQPRRCRAPDGVAHGGRIIIKFHQMPGGMELR